MSEFWHVSGLKLPHFHIVDDDGSVRQTLLKLAHCSKWKHEQLLVACLCLG